VAQRQLQGAERKSEHLLLHDSAAQGLVGEQARTNRDRLSRQ